jgi:hypothetical protein
VSRDENAVLVYYDIGLDHVHSHRNGEPICFDRLFWEVARCTAMGDHQRRAAVEGSPRPVIVLRLTAQRVVLVVVDSNVSRRRDRGT